MHPDYTGGPAFPVAGFPGDSFFPAVAPHVGMTLRDYFAAHADQPGTNEAYLLAVEQGEPPMPEGAPHESFSYRVCKWWDGLPLDRRLQLYAACRWRTADAMLAAREGGAK